MMQSIPVATSLFLCDYLLVEHRKMKVSPIGVFSSMEAENYPLKAPPFSVFATLTDGLGRGKIRLVAARLDTMDVIYEKENVHDFVSPLTEVRYHLRVERLVFPSPIWYQFTLLVEGNWVGHCKLHLKHRKGPS